MASYRPFPPPPPQSNFGPPPPPPPNQTTLPPPPLAPTPQPRGNLYSQNWNYPNSSFQPGGYVAPPRNPVPNQQQQYSSYPPHPPPPESAYPPPPPPSQPAPLGQMYFPSSQYPQFNNQPLPQSLQPPPPPSSPPSSSIPPPPPPPSQPPSPPPPPSSVPVTNQTKENRQADHKGTSKDLTGSKLRDSAHSHHKVPSRQHSKSSALPPMPTRTLNGPPGRVETEEERRMRKKREMEKQREDEKHRQQLKESQNKILQKTQMLSSAIKPHGSISGSHMGERRATPFLSGDRTENRLKKPTTFLCKLKFWDELPDPTSQPKLLSLRRDKDRAAKYTHVPA